MSHKFGKLWPSATLSMLAGTCLLSAQDDAHMRNLENRVTALESRKDNCCTVNPPARPFNPDCWGLYITVDPLIWQGRMNGTGYAVRTTDGVSFFNENGTATVLNPEFGWAWGVRVGLGLNQAHDGWDTLLQYTYWSNSSTRSRSPGDNQRIFPVLGHPARTFGANVQTGSAKTKLENRLNMLDLENGREFFVSKYLTIRPHAGLRTAWLKTEWDTTYSGLANNILAPDVARDINQELKYWGLGIRMGFDLQWGLGCGFSIFSNWADSVMYSYMKAFHEEKSIGADGASAQYQATRDFYHWGTQIVDMQLGLRWDWMSCDDCYHFGIEAGWENHLFADQNQFIRWVDDGQDAKLVTNQGNFLTQGWFAKFRFDF